jgi:hypothetical protein
MNAARIRGMRSPARLVSGLALLVLAASPEPVGSSLDRFRYQPEKIRVGEVAHYVKSNLDGSKPTRVSIFVAARDRVEVAKVEQGVIDAAWVRAHFDWTLFSADRIEAAVLNLDGSVESRAELSADPKTGVVSMKVGDMKGAAAWGWAPFHIYNFDFTSLNFAWRHLANPKSSFTIGVMDPTFKAEGDIFVDRGQARIEYLRDEPLHGRTCALYRISGPGIGGKTGSIWADPKSGWVEKVEIPFPDNPDWSSFRLELQGVETMTPEAWKNFMTESLAKANAKT